MKLTEYCEGFIDEIGDAKKYAEKYIDCKARGSEHARKYYDMAEDELKHAGNLHDFAGEEAEKLRETYKVDIFDETWNEANKKYAEICASVKWMLTL